MADEAALTLRPTVPLTFPLAFDLSASDGVFGTSYAQTRVLADGNTILQRTTGILGLGDSDELTFSCWLRFTEAEGSVERIIDVGDGVNGSNATIKIFRTLTGVLSVRIFTDAYAQIISVTSTYIPAQEELFHLIFSIDTIGGVAYLYFNDVDDSSGTPVGTPIGTSAVKWNILARHNGDGQKYSGEIGDLWVSDEFIDLSATANRRKFIDGSGNPVFLGNNGELPTGTAPPIFFGSQHVTADWNAGTNLGTGGIFSVVGAFADSPTPGPYVQNPVYFGEGVNMNNGTSLGGLSDGKQGTLSVWLNVDDIPQQSFDRFFSAGDGVTLGNGVIEVLHDGDEDFSFRFRNSSYVDVMRIDSTDHPAGLFHAILSFDLSTSTIQLYINDAPDGSPTTNLDQDVAYSQASSWTVAGRHDTTSNDYYGDVGDIWFSPEFIDLSVVSNRRKFINEAGDPVYLGNNGQVPTGTAPPLFFGSLHTAANWNSGTNLGGGGNFTMTGAVTDV